MSIKLTEMKNYCFRAVYCKNLKDGEVEYRSVPLNEADEPYDTVGVYELSEEQDNNEPTHVIDMLREEFQMVQDSRFPNGFESWQRSHYAVVSALNGKGFNGKNSFYAVALEMTNRFESIIRKNPVKEKDRFGQIEKYIESELTKTDYIAATLKDLF